MLYKALLVLFPTVAYAQVNLRVQIGLNGTNDSIQFDGSEVGIILDTELRQAWEISDEQLKVAVQYVTGKRPENIFVKSKPPLNNLYKQKNWTEVHRSFQVHSVYIVDLKYDLVDIGSVRLVNNGTVPATYNASVRQAVEETVSIRWNANHRYLILSQPITHSIMIGAGDETPASINFTGKWGESTNISKTVTIGTENEFPVQLPPGESAVYTLKAFRGSVQVQVLYVAELNGTVGCDGPGVNNYWPIDIKSLLTSSKLFSAEFIKIGFYANPKLYNNNTDRPTFYISQKTNQKRLGFAELYAH